jgi:hypothetical protein
MTNTVILPGLTLMAGWQAPINNNSAIFTAEAVRAARCRFPLPSPRRGEMITGTPEAPADCRDEAHQQPF